MELKKRLEASKLRLGNIKDDNKKVQFYTGFPTYGSLVTCYNFLGPAVDSLVYWGGRKGGEVKHAGGRSRTLPPMEEFFWL